MSRSPRWVRPALATASIVAVAAASVIVGASLAPAPAEAPEPDPAMFATQALPILQPVGYGQKWESVALDDENSLSYEQGTREVRVDADGVPTPGADLREAVRILSEAPD